VNFEVTHPAGFSKLDVNFQQDEVLYAQPKSMLCMSTGFDITAHVGGAAGPGSLLGGVKSMLSGESFATAKYRAKRDGVWISVAPTAIGEVRIIELSGGPGIYLTKGAYLAHQEGVILTPKFSGFKGLMAKKGIFLLHASGKGSLCISSFGAIVERNLVEDEVLVVDNDYVLTFSDTLEYELRAATKSITHSLMSGEGLVNRYKGPGQILYQTRSRQRGGLISSIINLST